MSGDSIRKTIAGAFDHPPRHVLPIDTDILGTNCCDSSRGETEGKHCTGSPELSHSFPSTKSIFNRPD